MSISELEAYVDFAGEKKYRAAQITAALIKGDSFAEMLQLPEKFRHKLMDECTDTVASVNRHLKSSDGTQKLLFGFDDGENVESVLMKYKYGNTVCISTQAGCRMGCRFCASTVNGFRRNLTSGEMLEQVIRT
ncbi:MAG TPA: 23S rRNA (adenine(2503)-C(2))-methyltransferase RlmN, partial [Bacillota bacterium]|nr:23S rRNA (adenine(2503)-C(2))-methyltransferase RlmN [Bacillota bacterium]